MAQPYSASTLLQDATMAPDSTLAPMKPSYGRCSGMRMRTSFSSDTHTAIEMDLDPMQLINLGSVSNHVTEDTRASYVILEALEHSYAVERRVVEYDTQAAIDHVQAVNHPAADFLIQHLSGELQADWSASFQSGKSE